MSLPSRPPDRTTSQLNVREGDQGWPVYAIQCGLIACGAVQLRPDGDFGPKTRDVVRWVQGANGLTIDGVVGYVTRQSVVKGVCNRIADEIDAIPGGLPHGLAHGEGGDNPAAVNWSVAGGVDCGAFQIRVYGPPYPLDRLKVAFDPYQAGRESMLNIVSRAKSFAKPHSGCPFTPLQLAVLAHNWPYAAQKYHDTGTIPNPDGPAAWSPTSLPVADRTRAGWCRFYVKAMGA